MAKVLRLLGYVLLGLGVAIIVVGLGAVLVSQGWEAFTDLFSPFNLLNLLVMTVILVPGILLVSLAERMEKRKN
ncbi:MAG: hypothetical protein H6Q51_64 [Deltaproteobacteria bacterium]|nr:hypothetical protein [Deltaproteobacteria bacterium]